MVLNSQIFQNLRLLKKDTWDLSRRKHWAWWSDCYPWILLKELLESKLFSIHGSMTLETRKTTPTSSIWLRQCRDRYTLHNRGSPHMGRNFITTNNNFRISWWCKTLRSTTDQSRIPKKRLLESTNSRLSPLPLAVSKCTWLMEHPSIWPTKNTNKIWIWTTKVLETSILIKIRISIRCSWANSATKIMMVLLKTLMAIQATTARASISRMLKTCYLGPFTTRLNQLGPLTWTNERRKWKMLIKTRSQKEKAWLPSEASITKWSCNIVKTISSKTNHSSLLFTDRATNTSALGLILFQDSQLALSTDCQISNSNSLLTE